MLLHPLVLNNIPAYSSPHSLARPPARSLFPPTAASAPAHPLCPPACSGITWMTKDGLQKPNYYGSLTHAATVRVGNYRGEEIHVPFSSLLPMVHPNDIVLGGWDISGLNLADAMERAQVFDFELQKQLVPLMRGLTPLPGIYDPSFIAANQAERADNLIKGSKRQQMEAVRGHIRAFKADAGVDSVVVLWTANTERYSEVIEGLNDTPANLMRSIDADEAGECAGAGVGAGAGAGVGAAGGTKLPHAACCKGVFVLSSVSHRFPGPRLPAPRPRAEVSPSTLYAAACVLEGVPFINGSPQNTFVPGLIDMAVEHDVLIGGCVGCDAWWWGW